MSRYFAVAALGLAAQLVACAGDDPPPEAAADAEYDARADVGAADAGEADVPLDDVADARLPDPPTRRYGNVPTALDREKVIVYAAHHISEDSNLVALHIDALGIPWLEFGNGDDPPDAWLQKLDEVQVLVDGIGHPVYLALTPLWIDRARLTADASSPFVPTGGPCLADVPDWEVRKLGYKAYVEFMVQRFDPVFLALSIEVNTYVNNCPDAWPELRSLLNEVYAEQKAARPKLPVFNTFTINPLWNAAGACAGFREDCIDEGLEAIGDLSGDVFAISTYPMIVYLVNGGTLPDNWLSIFREKTGLPVAIAETGWQYFPIETQDPDMPEACLEIPSSAESHLWWVERVLADAETLDMPFVVWWANQDYVPPEVSQSCVCDNPEEPWCDFLDRAVGRLSPARLLAFVLDDALVGDVDRVGLGLVVDHAAVVDLDHQALGVVVDVERQRLVVVAVFHQLQPGRLPVTRQLSVA